jgi:hypothetical protein
VLYEGDAEGSVVEIHKAKKPIDNIAEGDP